MNYFLLNVNPNVFASNLQLGRQKGITVTFTLYHLQVIDDDLTGRLNILGSVSIKLLVRCLNFDNKLLFNQSLNKPDRVKTTYRPPYNFIYIVIYCAADKELLLCSCYCNESNNARVVWSPSGHTEKLVRFFRSGSHHKQLHILRFGVRTHVHICRCVNSHFWWLRFYWNVIWR
jgi:hypothetical protein